MIRTGGAGRGRLGRGRQATEVLKRSMINRGSNNGKRRNPEENIMKEADPRMQLFVKQLMIDEGEAKM